MNNENRNTIILVLIVLVVCVIALGMLIRIVWSIAAKPIYDTLKRSVDTVTAIEKDNYNFSIPDKENVPLDVIENKPNNNPNFFSTVNYYKTDFAVAMSEPVVLATDNNSDSDDNQTDKDNDNDKDDQDNNGSDNNDNQTDKDDQDNDKQNEDKQTNGYVVAIDQVMNFNFDIPEATLVPIEDDYQAFPSAIVEDAKLAVAGETEYVNRGSLSLSIPKINVKGNILQGLDAEKLLEQGFWMHPGSYTLGEGEIVLLCHRRFFGPSDPRTCWYLDKMAKGDEINVNFNGDELKYKVVGTNIFDGNDPLIYKIDPNKDYIKIVTCTPLYSNEQRLVVLAERVN